MINVEQEDGEILSITIDGEGLDSEGDDRWVLPKYLLKGLRVADLPEGAIFQVCDRIEESVIILDSIPIYIRRTNTCDVEVEFEDMGRRKYWDGQIGFKPYMEAKKAVIEERSAELDDIKLTSYDDDGDYIHLTYSANLNADSCATIVELAEQIIGEIEGATEMRLGAQAWKLDIGTDEKQFTLQVVLPILRKLGFSNVRYNHGKREYGKDIVFARRTEFDELEHWGVQIKYGDISGGAGSEIDKIISQADDAFKMPFYDIYTRQQQRISKLAVVISGKFTENAIEKVCEKIESHAMRNNLVFLDGEKLLTLAETFRP